MYLDHRIIIVFGLEVQRRTLQICQSFVTHCTLPFFFVHVALCINARTVVSVGIRGGLPIGPRIIHPGVQMINHMFSLDQYVTATI